MGGFFNTEDVVKAANCPACGLLKTAVNPQIPVTGKGDKGILIVVGSPTAQEDRSGSLGFGNGRQWLQKTLKSSKVDMFQDCWMLSAVRCYLPGDREPRDGEVSACRPSIYDIIRTLKPVSTILLGQAAVESVLFSQFEKDYSSLKPWTGWQIPSRKWNTWICPMESPETILAYRKEADKNLGKLFLRTQLRNAAKKRRVPWPQGPPDDESKVECLWTDKEIIQALKWFREQGIPTAFDYETTGLKPEGPGHRIVSMSLSNGKRTVAFLVTERVKGAICRFLTSDVPKIAANLQLEERWSVAILGVYVNNWYWDTMLGTHFIDNRSLICSLKFQAFVRLGAEDYSSHIVPFFNSESPNGLNHIDDVPPPKLLLYNGLDSLYEYELAIKQIRDEEGMQVGTGN